MLDHRKHSPLSERCAGSTTEQKTIPSPEVVVKLNALIQDIDLRGFQIFLDCLLEVSTPVDLCRNLFSSFLRSPVASETGRSLNKRSSLQLQVKTRFVVDKEIREGVIKKKKVRKFPLVSRHPPSPL